jgi:hypothetical protein
MEEQNQKHSLLLPMAEEVCKKVNPFAHPFSPSTPLPVFSIFNTFSIAPYLCK